MLIDHDDGATQVQRFGLSEHPIEQRQHLGIRVGAATEQDQPGRSALSWAKRRG